MTTKNNTESIYKLGTTFFDSYHEIYLTITGRLLIGQKWKLTWNSNPTDYLFLSDYEISQRLKDGKLILTKNLHN